MTQRKKEVIVGIVFVGALAVLGVFTILIGGVDPFNPPKTLWVYFRDVGGLRQGNVVRVAGLEVGQVDEMKLIENGVLVKLRVNSSVELHEGYSITVRSFSPLGGKYVDIDRGNLAAPKIPIPSRPPTKAEILGIEGRAGEAGPGGGAAPGAGKGSGGPGGSPGEDRAIVLQGRPEPELISELADLAEKVKPAILEAADNIRDVTAKINQMHGTLGKLVNDPTIHDSLASAAVSIDRAAREAADLVHKISEGSGTLARLANDPALYDVATDTLRRVNSIAQKVDGGVGTVGALFNDEALRARVAGAVARIESLLAKADEGKGTVGRLFNDDRVYENLAAALASIRETAGAIAGARGPLGVLLRDEKAGEDLRRTIAHLERVAEAIAEGRGTLGRLIMDDRLIVEAERVIVEVRESVEDVREQAPINSFATAVLQGAF